VEINNDALNMTLVPTVPVKNISTKHAIVLAPHPDDEVFGCGGAIISHVRQNQPVKVIILTNGELQGSPELRRHESNDAALILGYGQPEYWKLPDGQLVCNQKTIDRLIELTKEHNTDLIYAPSPWEVHADHRQAAMLAINVAKAAGVRICFYEIGVPLCPNILLDISNDFDHKKLAMKCFESQFRVQNYFEQISALNAYRSYHLGSVVTAAEAYLLLSPHELDSRLSEHLRSSPSCFGHLSELEINLEDRPPLVSVIVRSIDRSTLQHALYSIAMQTYTNIEVMVVSATATHQPLPEKCGIFPLQLIQTGSSLHRSDAANIGLSNAKGLYCIFLDDDDWFLPEHIRKLVKHLHGQKLYKAAYTGVAFVDQSGKPMGQTFDLPYDLARLLSGNIMPIHAVLFSRELIAQGCIFDNTIDHYEDWDFWIQVGRLTLFAHIPGISAAYRIHNSSGIHAESVKNTSLMGDIHKKWINRLQPSQLSDFLARVWTMDSLTTEMASQKKINQNLEEVIKVLEIQITENRVALEQVRGLLNSALSSTSWRVTSPLRAINAFIKRIVG
jgi:LmbE family N-acetylglucosaminyl deacetylase